jgi:hypothetical protein
MFTLSLPKQAPIDTPSGEITNILPETTAEFEHDTATFWQSLFNGDNFSQYAKNTETVLILFLRLLPFFIMFVFLIRQYIKSAFERKNNDYNQDSKPMLIFKKISSVTYTPAKQFILGFFEYLQTSPLPKVWLLIWLLNFNIFAVILSLFSITLYFFISFDIPALYSFVYNTIDKLMPAFRFIPGWCWVVLALWVVDIWRKSIALNHLRHNENKNKGFILERSICTMLVGTMGKGKTTLITDMALSTEAIFRSKAHELLIETDMKFPYFPYIVLENELKQAIENNEVFNLASCGEWVKRKQGRYDRFIRRAVKHGVERETLVTYLSGSDLIFGYDSNKYGLYFDDKKTMIYLFDALKDYAKLYVIYITASSLLISNYAVRTDFIKKDAGNFPDWDLDFFTRNSRRLNEISRHSHILDFDMLRLGKKMVENNRLANVFEFGVVIITEVGKERGNQFKTQEIKETVSNLRNTIKELEKAKTDATKQKKKLLKLTERATQLNDKFNDALKLIRHKCTVCGFPFARVFMDEQRPESLGADARDLCEVVQIKDKSETRLAMPFFFIEELLYYLVFPKFLDIYAKHRFNRGDNTLLMYLTKMTVAFLHGHYTGIYNRFGYHIAELVIEDGATSEELKRSNYYLSTKKIYSNRFATDAYSDIFAKGLRTVNLGVNDIKEYATHKATEDELKKQNSYLTENFYGGENEE